MRVQIGAAPLSALSACPTPFHLVVLYEQQLVVINRLNKKARDGLPACRTMRNHCSAAAPQSVCPSAAAGEVIASKPAIAESRNNPSAALAPTLRGMGEAGEGGWEARGGCALGRVPGGV